MNWYFKVLKNYATFTGRARRKEYWMFVLFNALASILLGFIDTIIGTINYETGLGTLSVLYTLAVLLPSIAVAVRRLHDIGKSGWWLLITLIPFIGGIVLIVFMCLDSQPNENEYGLNPKND